MGNNDKKGTAEQAEHIRFWAEYSTKNHLYEEVKKLAIQDSIVEYCKGVPPFEDIPYPNAGDLEKLKALEKMKKIGVVLCYTHLSKNQKLTPEQIEELMIITSPLFHVIDFRLDNKTCNEVVLHILDAGYDPKQQKKEIKDILAESERGELELPDKLKTFLQNVTVPSMGFQDRLDWYAIEKYQKYPKEFYQKHINIFKRREPLPHYAHAKPQMISQYSGSVIPASRRRKKVLTN